MSDSVEAAIQQAAASATATGTATPIVIKEDRSIVVPTAMQQIAVQCDNEANVLHFVCPRNWADIDLAAATLYINVVKPDKSTVAFVCTNVVSSEDTITFDWVVTEPVTDVVGKLSFLVCARDPSDPGNGYRWHSNLCDSLFVAPGIVCVVPSDTPDPPHIPLYGTDTTLTKPHVPADAAAVGERLSTLSEKVANLPQADWNQNDSTAADYVKNRPFYTGDPVETVLVEESTVAFTENNGLFGAEFPSTFSATVGETYKVSWDGSVYECTCGDLEGDTFLGNLSILGAGSDTGEPFVMLVFIGQGMLILTADTSASHTFSISKTVAPVVKIDKKYLVQPDWNQNDENAADFVKNRPFYAASLVSVRNPGIPEAFWYNVSDAVPTGDYSAGAPCSLVANGEKRNGEIFLSTDDYYAVREGLVFVALKDNVEVEGITFPKKGTYFAYVSGNPVITGFALGADADSEITWDGRTEKELKKLDAKFLPDNLATKSEVEAAQTAANAAQTAARNAQTTANAAQSAAAESVKFISSQNLTDAQKKRARTNIGAGTSNFSGSYDDLTHKPVAVQSDWNVNKNSDTAYIKNRTHYDYTAYSRIAFSKSPTASSLINDTHYYGETTGGSLKIDEGSIYKVSCNNSTTYESTCKTLPLQGQPLSHTCKILGNVQLGVDAGYLDINSPHFPVTDVDTGEPWCFMSYNYTAKNAIISTIPNFSIHGISVQTAHELKQLDEKYIPSTIQRVGDDLVLSSSTEGSTKKFRITVDDSGTISATEVV